MQHQPSIILAHGFKSLQVTGVLHQHKALSPSPFGARYFFFSLIQHTCEKSIVCHSFFLIKKECGLLLFGWYSREHGLWASTGASGHWLRVSCLQTLGDASETKVCSDQEAAAPPVCLCMHYCFIFLELEIISFDKQKWERVLGSCHFIQFLSYSDGSHWAWLSWTTLYFCLPFKKN